MDKEQLKKMMIEMIQNDELSISLDGYSTEYSYCITASLNIDGDSYIQEEVHLDK